MKYQYNNSGKRADLTGNRLLMCMILFLMSLTAVAQQPAQNKKPANKMSVKIDAGKNIGVIRPLHGGNLGPVSPLRIVNLSDYFRRCKIPVVRLHDAPWFTSYAVDITTIFRDFNADASKEENYDFRQTDDYIDSILATGAEIVYRLGESIEWTKRSYNVNPPKDFKKWAEICCNIIRHYNEGWANGFHHKIKYWEIWNEPDMEKPTWTGTRQQFFDLYKITSQAIKQQFPEVEVGGPAVAIPLIEKDGKFTPSEFTSAFLNFCQKESVPLDFFSWHTYSQDPWELSHRPTFIREVLDKHQFTKTKSFLNEWNYTPPGFSWAQGEIRARSFENQSSVMGGAFLANVLMLLQDEPIDMANYYMTSAGMYGLFSDFGVPHKSSFAFEAFSDLVNHTPTRLEAQYDKKDSLVICAGTNAEKNKIAVLVSNFSPKTQNVEFTILNNFLTGPVKYALYVVDETHNFSKVKEYTVQPKETLQISEKIKGPSVALLQLVKG